MNQLWRRLQRRRSPARLSIALMLLVVSAILALIPLLPEGWLSPLAIPISLTDLHFFAAMSSAILALIGLPLLLTPRAWHFANAQRPIIAPISVYLDLENQPLHEKDVKLFLGYLRDYYLTWCHTSHADQFFYADPLYFGGEDGGQAYRALWRYGFRPIEAPHKFTSTKDTADLIMALHAFERALLADEPRDIIIISADHDFLPLVYQLHYMGHRVHLLARMLPPDLKSLDLLIGIKTSNIGEMLTPPPLTPDMTEPSGRSLTKPTVKKKQKIAPPPLFDVTMPDPLERALTITINTVYAAQTTHAKIEDRKKALTAAIGTILWQRMLETIGFNGKGGAGIWITLGETLDLFSTQTIEMRPNLTTDLIAEATSHLRQFLAIVIREGIAIENPLNRTTNLTQLANQFKKSNTTSPDEFLALSHFTEKSPSHVRRLLRCAKQLGLIRLGEMGPADNTVKIIRPDLDDDQASR